MCFVQIQPHINSEERLGGPWRSESHKCFQSYICSVNPIAVPEMETSIPWANKQWESRQAILLDIKVSSATLRKTHGYATAPTVDMMLGLYYCQEIKLFKVKSSSSKAVLPVKCLNSLVKTFHHGSSVIHKRRKRMLRVGSFLWNLTCID